MTTIRSLGTASLAGLLALLLILAPGCSKNDDDPSPAPGDPVADLVQGGGGTGGGLHGGTVTVVVFDDQDGTRILGATVVLVSGGTPVTQSTDASGTAVFTGVASGPYSVTLAKTSYENMSVFGFEAALVVLPLESSRLRVEGTVIGGSGSGTTYGIAFSTFEEDIFNAWNEPPLFGEVEKLPTGGDPTYRIRIDKGQTDTLVFTETDNTSGRIVNRKTLALGPFTADQTGVNVTFDGTTGLHEISGTILNLQNFVTTGVQVTYYDTAARRRWLQYDVNGSGMSRTYSMQLPPNRTLDLVLTATIAGQGFLGLPQEAQVFTVATGAADNTTPTTVDLPFDLVSVTGSFTNYGSCTYIVLGMRFAGQNTALAGLPAANYSLRVPRTQAGRLVLAGFDGSNVLQKALEDSFGPYSTSGIRNFDLAAAAPSLLTVTANAPTGITTHDAGGGFYGYYSPLDSAYPPFLVPGAAAGPTITYNVRYVTPNGADTLFVVGTEENTNSQVESRYFRGAIADPAAVLGTTESITLLQIPAITAPADGGNANKNAVFSWAADSALSSSGFTIIEVEEAVSGTSVWHIIVAPSVTSVTLPSLPPALAALELQSGTQYLWNAGAIWRNGLDVNGFSIGTFKSMEQLVLSGVETKIANTADFTFTVN